MHDLLSALEAMADEQYRKVLRMARESVPGLTEDDFKNPDDFKALHHDPRFNYEDGVLAGLRMALTGARARLRERDPGFD